MDSALPPSTLDSPTVHPAPSTLDSGEGGLSINAYAAAHHVSPKTVRRRIKAGTLAAVRIDGPHGEEYRIPTLDTRADHPPQAEPAESTLPVYPPQGSLPSPTVHAPSAYEARWVAGVETNAKLLRELAEAQARAAELEGKAGELRQVVEERDHLRRLVDEAAAAQEQLRILLQREQDHARGLAGQLEETRRALLEERRSLPAPSPPKRVPWWRRWGG